MIVIFHKNNKVLQVYDYSRNLELAICGNTIQEVLVLIAAQNKLRFIGWCHDNLRESLNLTAWKIILKHEMILVSFETSTNYYITSDIGYVEESPFVNVNKNNLYPTWLMSSDVGVIHASVLLKFKNLSKYKLTFEFFLNFLSKAGMKQGLLCYSNSALLKKEHPIIAKKEISQIVLFQFIKSNYKFRWVFLYLFNQLVYKKKFLGGSLLLSIFKKKISTTISLAAIQANNKEKKYSPTIDVLIPTLGREKHLHNVLLDLSKQTIVPKKVIIVEQNEVEGAPSELDFLDDEWPFKINHTLIYQLGACNARNIALQKVTSEWVFFADDDVRFNPNLLEDAFKYIDFYKCEAISLACLQKGEIEKTKFVIQSAVFGSGTSVVKSKSLNNIKFNMAYEFGYGEDTDFGMQLRNTGIDILYIPFVSMLHLKATIGGFRKKIEQQWEQDYIQPKPSPTVMVYKLLHATKEQLQSYRITLFLKFYKSQSVKNPISYFKQMNMAWNKSRYWAEYLIKKHSNEI